jgi:hypothetical protein
MFTLPVAGTALYVMDQYLHPRNLATALILFAVSRILDGKRWQAIQLAAVAFALHPLMGVFGISFCCVLTLTTFAPLRLHLQTLRARLLPHGAPPAFAFIPFGWIISPPSPIWLEALRSRRWLRIYPPRSVEPRNCQHPV